MKTEQTDRGTLVTMNREESRKMLLRAHSIIQEELEKHTHKDALEFHKAIIESESAVRNSVRALIALDRIRYESGDKDVKYITETAQCLVLEHLVWKCATQKPKEKGNDQ